MKRSKKWKTRTFLKMAYHGSTSTSFTLAGGSGNDVITDYVNPQLRKSQLRGNVNVVPVYACANTHNARCQLDCVTDYATVTLPGWECVICFFRNYFFSTFTCCEVSSFDKSHFQDHCLHPVLNSYGCRT